MLYRSQFHILSKIPGPRFPAATSLWIRWQRWHGRLSFEADKLLSLYGPVVRIAPNLVLVNDVQSVQSLFARQDLDTAPTAIRALRIGGHDWTVTYPQNPVARSRRRPVMVATTNKAMRYWQSTFDKNISQMVHDLGATRGRSSEDIVYHLRVATLLNSQAVMAGPQANLEPGDFPHVVGEYNFLVVWRLCLPEWLFYWLKWSPFRHAAFRVQSSDRLFRLGKEIVDEAANWAEDDAVSTVHELLAKSMKAGRFEDDPTEISAEMAGQILAATETTSSALAFIFYYLAREPNLVDALYDELQSAEGLKDLEGLQLLNACITEGLRFRPPVALTGSRVVPPGGLSIMGYFVPAGTVVTTQSLSLSRQRPDLFPNYDEYDPARWLEDDDKLISERRRCLAPFGIGARRCPGGNMATFQMRMILAAVVREFHLSVAPETTPLSMTPFEANGFRSRLDACRLVFTPRDLRPQPGPRGCECGTVCDCVECLCVHYDEH
ncbi:cytochrome P450 monooxygenase-like protein [Microdochium trichocladiopsis]|uniref:Cytochrome P450 monooxygenase-like protein n=1 Tax=Microdochium trichocladiopsis TaxID=1682393 RepID=A0A9P8YFR1_9PEZI|nr:cytochrome P450 monooxygenase-like protein [Microdochium trichocladiopsis]KAH7039544.1 cytochrome P450 monooxygenase-like protein [Microdochium trichocladiopsis]